MRSDDADSRKYDVRGTYNLRDTGGYRAGVRVSPWRTLLRSDALHNIQDDGREKLAELGVRHIVDLRGASERRRSPSALDGLDVEVHELPVFDEADPERQLARGIALAPLYEHIVEERGEQLVEAIRVIATADAPVLVHCTAGKDRTGLVVAFALAAAGVERDDVIADYAATEQNLAGEWTDQTLQRVRARGMEMSEGLVEIMSLSPAPVMADVLDRVDRDLGGARAYLRSRGLAASELDALGSRLAV